MSSLTNINNNSYVVNVGRTTPVSPGQQTADKSIPVVVASDQEPIPVVEQNKVLSEVALSLLGIPRSEVALGIFADVNTYDVNPTEWSSEPNEYTLNSSGDGWGIKHLPEEAGALIEAPKDKTAVLTSKRFFRYQPGRVSAATFGVKSSNSPSPNVPLGEYDLNPSIRKYGIFDKYDGYYWETRGDSTGDNFSVVRRTQSLLRNNPVPFGPQKEDHALSGKAANVTRVEPNASPSATKFLIDNRFKIIELAFADALDEGTPAATTLNGLSAENKAKCKRDMDLAMEAYILDLQYGGNGHTIVNATTYRLAAVVDPTVEVLVHTKLAQQISTQLTTLPMDEPEAAARIISSPNTGTLSAILIAALNAPTTYPDTATINAAVYGTRSGISTVFAIYSKFFGYISSEYRYDANYDIQSIPGYLSSGSTLSPEEIKYRCFRDVTYVMSGYAQDLEFGGNASTIYNAKRYYFNGVQIYSQTPSGSPQGEGINAEILRHTFIRQLITGLRPDGTTYVTTFNIPTIAGKSFTCLTSLFPSVFNTAARDKLNTLSNLIIENFSEEYTGAIDYGSGSQYGDLVVLRDGLIMTHAAVYDPSLLKPTKNVVAKPGFALRTNTTGASSSSTLVIANALTLGIIPGLSVRASVSGIPDGVTVVSVSGSNVVLSAPIVGTIPIGTNISFGNCTLEVSQDEFVVGQYINFYGNAAGLNSNGLTANRLYRVEKVRGVKGNIITLSDATVKNKFKASITGTSLTITENASSIVLAPGMRIEGKGLAEGTTLISRTSGLASEVGAVWSINNAPTNAQTNIDVTIIAVIGADLNPSDPAFIYINPNVPFVFPSEYYTGKTSNPNGAKRPDGMFPLMYVIEGRTLPATALLDNEKVGYIDTTIVNGTNPSEIRGQIDTVNLMYNNWIKQNVDPKYYSVYEFRIPRSRFSTDQLNGELNTTVYSDLATSPDGKVYPGTVVNNGGVALQTRSVWDIDFTKVTMLKVEFSWYGAVGALFLAYVPVGNGEARWVRVHHLRASNQLKISSLGNATLPITYLVYGGGSVSRLGIADTVNKGYTNSNHVVKYGASYYIDGGDRGTVRLYSHSTLDPTNVYGSRYSLASATTGTDAIGRYIDVTGVTGLPSDKKFFMKAKLLTGSRADQNVEVVWVAGNRLYINKGVLESYTNLVLIANRPSVVFGLKAKENILNAVGVGVRNRVQVYPTKLSTSSIAPVGVTTSPKVKLQLLKTPIYQPLVATDEVNGFQLTAPYPITPSNSPLPTSSNYLSKDGEGVYGWFRANVGTVFGYLYKESGNYYFTLLETYSEDVILGSSVKFLADGRYTFNGDNLPGVSEDTIQKERLSSVFVSTQIQCPVPKTGIEVASFFLQEGSDLFDLLNYFDYNKDYLSFPLTNKVESIYLVASSVQASGANPVAEINSSLTWEEQ